MPRRVMRPLESFLELEAGSALLLMAAAVAALVWVNVAGGSYEDFWATEVVVEIGPLELHEGLGDIVNDLLMAVFFFVVSLEVKREIVFGSLRERSSAAVPVAAALGTMVGGAVVYLAVNLGGGESGADRPRRADRARFAAAPPPAPRALAARSRGARSRAARSSR